MARLGGGGARGPDDFDAGDHEPELAVLVLNIAMINMFHRLNVTTRQLGEC
jgi:hypothetical protein